MTVEGAQAEHSEVTEGARGARGRHRARRPLIAVGAAAAALATLGALIAGPGLGSAAPSAAPTPRVTCEQFGSMGVSGDKYVIANNRWGAATEQCLTENGPTGFTVSTAKHVNNKGPAGYPSIYRGCNYGYCTKASPFPVRVAQLGDVRSSWSTTGPKAVAGQVQQYATAYDIWFDPTTTNKGRNTGAEMMIWLNRTSWVQPIGKKATEVRLAGTTWEIWYGKLEGLPVVSYVRKTPTTSVSNLPLQDFVRDATLRRVISPLWYMTSVQAGFEPWTGGQGLTTNSFSVTRNGK